MSAIGSQGGRSVVPRWRTSAKFAASDEVQVLAGSRQRSLGLDGWYDRAYADWIANPTMGYLADLFSTAVVEQRFEHIAQLAAAVRNAGDKVPPALQRLAECALPDSTGAIEQPIRFDVEGNREVLSRRISQLRRYLVDYGRDGFAWHDLSYMYNLSGEARKAERAMYVALKVTDSHRVIARGASRLFVHRSETGAALDILRRARGFSSDPWLMSAHLAIAQASGSESVHIPAARRLLERLGGGVATSELGMAVATHELLNGKLKKAKFHARGAAKDATENAIAQAVWLGPRLNTELVSGDTVAGASQGFEARTWDSYYQGHWRDAMRYALQWLQFEPFSTTPALQGSFIAATMLQDYALSVSVAEFGLAANPDSWMLRNNLVVGLALTGEVGRAAEEFQRLNPKDVGGRDLAVWTATNGLLQYRSGDAVEGRRLYEEARDYLLQHKDRSGQIVLALYQSVEEASVGNGDYARTLVQGVCDNLGIKKSDQSLLSLLHDEVIRTERDSRRL